MHVGERDALGAPESPFWASGTRGLGDGGLATDEARGGGSVQGSGLVDCVVSDGMAGPGGHCDGRGCGRGRGGDAGSPAAMMARPTGLENAAAAEEVWRVGVSGVALALALW